MFFKLMKCNISHSPSLYNRQTQVQQSSRDIVPELFLDAQLQPQLQLKLQLQLQVQLQVQIVLLILLLLLLLFLFFVQQPVIADCSALC